MVTMNSMVNELQFFGYRKLNNECPSCETLFLHRTVVCFFRGKQAICKRTFDSSACLAEFIVLDCTGSPESIIAEAQHCTFLTTRASRQGRTLSTHKHCPHFGSFSRLVTAPKCHINRSTSKRAIRCAVVAHESAGPSTIDYGRSPL
jgi:hypothetical protein